MNHMTTLPATVESCEMLAEHIYAMTLPPSAELENARRKRAQWINPSKADRMADQLADEIAAHAL